MWFPRFLSPLKPPLKRFRHRARTGYINRFHSFTPADFREKLRGLGVKTGDVLCVQSPFDQFLGFQGNVGDAIRSFKKPAGPNGVSSCRHIPSEGALSIMFGLTPLPIWPAPLPSWGL